MGKNLSIRRTTETPTILSATQPAGRVARSLRTGARPSILTPTVPANASSGSLLKPSSRPTVVGPVAPGVKQ